ncbi:MAG: AmmeMemoRadiSam system protein B, partial [Thermodesulfobacteriota bacterium]
AMVVLQLMDGRDDLRDIQGAILREYGQMIEYQALRNLAEALDDNFYLEGPTFQAAMCREMDSPWRPALLAGQSYPADPGELTALFSSFFGHASGPGEVPPAERCAAPAGLMAPHIDYARGGPCYAWAYAQLEPATPPDLVVILGTAHAPLPDALSVGAKDLATPFGPVACAQDLAREISARLGLSRTEDELASRCEHSVELQAVWLAGHYRGAGRPLVLPLLVGSFLPLIEQGLSPEESPRYEESLGVLAETLEDWAGTHGRVTLLASVDLSHVGPQFEDEFPVTPAVLEEVRDSDLALLERVAAGDHAGFYAGVAAKRDRTHICGLAAIYTLLRLLRGRPGRLLAYHQWRDESGQGLVSFASLLFP